MVYELISKRRKKIPRTSSDYIITFKMIQNEERRKGAMALGFINVFFFFSWRFRYPSCPGYFGGRNRRHQRCHGVAGSQHSSGRLLGNRAGGGHIGLRLLSHPQQVRVNYCP